MTVDMLREFTLSEIARYTFAEVFTPPRMIVTDFTRTQG